MVRLDFEQHIIMGEDFLTTSQTFDGEQGVVVLDGACLLKVVHKVIALSSIMAMFVGFEPFMRIAEFDLKLVDGKVAFDGE